FGSIVRSEQVFAPAIANGGIAVTDPITAAIVPLLVSDTFLDLLVPVASTLPRLIVAGDALSVVVGVAVAVGVGVGVTPVAVAVAVAVAVLVAVAVAVFVAVAVAVFVGVPPVAVAVGVGVGPAGPGWMATNRGSPS